MVAQQLYSAIFQHQPNHPSATQGSRQLQKELPHHQFQQAQAANPSPDQNSRVNLHHSGQMTKIVQACKELLQSYDRAIEIKLDFAEAYL